MPKSFPFGTPKFNFSKIHISSRISNLLPWKHHCIVLVPQSGDIFKNKTNVWKLSLVIQRRLLFSPLWCQTDAILRGDVIWLRGCPRPSPKKRGWLNPGTSTLRMCAKVHPCCWHQSLLRHSDPRKRSKVTWNIVWLMVSVFSRESLQMKFLLGVCERRSQRLIKLWLTRSTVLQEESLE